VLTSQDKIKLRLLIQPSHLIHYRDHLSRVQDTIFRNRFLINISNPREKIKSSLIRLVFLYLSKLCLKHKLLNFKFFIKFLKVLIFSKFSTKVDTLLLSQYLASNNRFRQSIVVLKSLWKFSKSLETQEVIDQSISKKWMKDSKQ
jgi:hypothetical protein